MTIDELSQVAYLPAVLLRALGQPTSELRGRYAAQYDAAADIGQSSFASGFAFSESDGELELVCLTSIEVDPAVIADILSELGRRFEPLVVRTSGPVVSAGRGRARGGDSLSREAEQPTGTLGCLVEDSRGQRMVLTCNHVIAKINKGQQGDRVWHPGEADGGGSGDEIGRLSDFKRINFGANVGNEIDAALFSPDPTSGVAPGIRNIGNINGVDRNPPFRTKVRKYGRKTNLTTGELQMKNLSTTIDFQDGSSAIFDAQYGVVGDTAAHFADKGDSGALVVEGQSHAVGMIIAVASGVDITYVSPIGPVLDWFGGRIV